MAVSCIVLRYHGEIFVENRDFFQPPAFNAPIRGFPVGTLLSIVIMFGIAKTRTV